jgi:hypothetical protein
MSAAPHWRILADGRSWAGEEAWDRFQLTPSKIDMVDGKLLDTQEDRELLLGLLLENVGADRVVRFGDPSVWRTAVEKLPS